MNTVSTTFGKTGDIRLGLKLIVIFFVILLLLIPLGMIGKIADERKNRALETAEEIIGMNGGRPSVIGPFLVVPVTVMIRNENNRLVAAKRHAAVLPARLDVKGDLQTEMRSRGIYSVPLFTGTMRLEADFSGVREKLELLLGTDGYTADWANAWYAVEFRDKRSLKSTPVLSIDDGAESLMKGSESSLGWSGSSVRTRTTAGAADSRVEVSFMLGGGGSLTVLPFGETVSCTVTSDWKAPSFSGYVLPSDYEITESGFTASWFIPDSSQPYPDAFLVEDTLTDLTGAGFGTDLFQPVSVYHKTERALKYGLLFIVVPFMVFFLFEIFLKRRIHPLQYALIGLADVLFYLVLLSFSEHLPFMQSYIAGALAVCLLTAFYSSAILGSYKRGLVMLPVLGGIYLFLYVALESEDYALLVGSIGVFAMVAVFMTLTRKIDWYAPLAGGGTVEE